MNKFVTQWKCVLNKRVLTLACLLSLALLPVAHVLADAQASTTAKNTSPASEGELAEEYSQFVRIKYDEKHRPLTMQVAALRFVPEDPASTLDYVDLISAVHIGERDYYQQINERFTHYDAVLYELVAPQGTRIAKGEKEHKTIVSNLQSSMRNVLGMSMQLEEVDYTVDNLVHADLSPREFKQSMEKRNESVAGMIGRAWIAGLGQQYSRQGVASEMRFYRNLLSGDKELALKIFAAEQMVQSIGMGEVVEGTEGGTLVSERNKKALQVLAQEIHAGKKNLAIFYGAAHMKDIAERMVSEFNFRPVKIEWIDAWDLR